MTPQQAKEIIDAMVEFVLRVSKGKATSEKEVEVLPEVVSKLKEFNTWYKTSMEIGKITDDILQKVNQNTNLNKKRLG